MSSSSLQASSLFTRDFAVLLPSQVCYPPYNSLRGEPSENKWVFSTFDTSSDFEKEVWTGQVQQDYSEALDLVEEFGTGVSD